MEYKLYENWVPNIFSFLFIFFYLLASLVIFQNMVQSQNDLVKVFICCEKSKSLSIH